MAGIYRERPGAADIAPAEEGPGVAIGRDLWMSKGVSNSYAIGTDDGRVVINAGLPFEGRIRRRAFDAVCPGPTRALLFTQGHADHFAGYRALLDDGTDIVMQRNWTQWKAEHELFPNFRPRNTSFAWSHMMEAMVAGMSSLPPEEWSITFPEPTVEFDDRLELAIGGRQVVLLSTPGGETTDALVVWVPDERTVFTGNLFGPLFGHVPNLVTIRGDRYREALQYVASADLVLGLGAERLVTGHFDPIVGADRIAEEVTNLRDATQWVHDRTIEGMEAGTDVLTLMRDVQVPANLDVGEGYGRTSWNVRAIWETYAGWFHHRSTTELFHVPPSAVAGDLVAAAGVDAILDAARARIAAAEYLEAIHLVEIVLAADETHADARGVAADAHERLLGQSTNFWEAAWLRHTAAQLRGDQ
jgi:alkyl sulfatase BDS1-like metallo-beta-lactamase superfamily hydrolase